jgi:hypothetical protein
MNRRHFLYASGGFSLSPLIPQNAPQNPASTEAAKDVTRTLARHIVSTRHADLSAAVRKEAARTLLNWVGCAVGGSRHETVDIAISAMAPFSGPAQASILGRKERLDILHTALINGISSHVLDYDDTHTRNIVHPAGPVISAILALSEHRPVSGVDFAPNTTKPDGTSRAPPASSVRRQLRANCSASASGRWSGRSAWLPLSLSAFRRCSDR